MERDQDIWLSIATSKLRVFLSTMWDFFFSPGLLLIMQVFVGILCGSMWNGWAVGFGCQHIVSKILTSCKILKKRHSCQTGVFLGASPGGVYAFFEAVNTDFEDFLQASTETSVSADLSVQTPTRWQRQMVFVTCVLVRWESKWYLCPSLKMAASKYNGPNFWSTWANSFHHSKPKFGTCRFLGRLAIGAVHNGKNLRQYDAVRQAWAVPAGNQGGILASNWYFSGRENLYLCEFLVWLVGSIPPCNSGIFEGFYRDFLLTNVGISSWWLASLAPLPSSSASSSHMELEAAPAKVEGCLNLDVNVFKGLHVITVNG